MHCLVTGASSQLGRPLLAQLVKHDYSVTAWTRDVSVQSTVASGSVLWQQADLLQPPAVPAATQLLIHLAPIDLLPTLLKTSALPALRIIAISTCSIRFKALSICPHEQRIAATLLAAEQQVMLLAKEQGHQLTVLRPSMLYGAGRDGTVGVLQAFIRRFGFLVLPAQATGLRQPVHVDDVVQAIIACVKKVNTVNKCYELGGADRLTLLQLAQNIFVQNQRQPRVLMVPRWLLRALIALVRWTRLRADWRPGLVARAQQSQVVDNRAAQLDFAYSPRAFDGRFVIGIDDAHD